MDTSFVAIVEDYQRKRLAGGNAADRKQLEVGRELLLRRLRDPRELDTVTAHKGTDLLFFFADREGIVELVSRYLRQALSVEERAWAWWEWIDNLCLLEQCAEAVAAHEDYLVWAQAQWQKGDFTSAQMLLTINDCTWARCWRSQGKIERWFVHFNTILAQVSPTPSNRLERFYCLRTACRILSEGNEFAHSLPFAARIRDIAQEDPGWERAWEMEVQALDMEAGIYRTQQRIPELRQVGERAFAVLENRGTQLTSAEAATRLAVQYDNVAATMFMADQYDLCIPLFRRCLELSAVSEFVYLALPAALWKTTNEREPVLQLLREGAARCRGGWFASDFRNLPEFEDVHNDSEFAAAVEGR